MKVVNLTDNSNNLTVVKSQAAEKEQNKSVNFQINPSNTLTIKNTVPTKKTNIEVDKSIDFKISSPNLT